MKIDWVKLEHWAHWLLELWAILRVSLIFVLIVVTIVLGLFDDTH